MPGMRRRLLDVGKKVTGVLAVPRDEGGTPDAPGAEQSPDEAATEPLSVEAPVGADAAGAAPTETAAPEETDPVPTATAPAAPDSPAAPDAAPALDAACAEAVDLARAAAVEEAGRGVGEHLGVTAEATDEGAGLATHSFAATEPGYSGWRWAVTVARAAGQQQVTVDEVVLLPGEAALLAPAWVPWSERIQPQDLSPGDLLPPAEDDPRLVPSYADVDAPRLPFDLHRELGLGRPRVLSLDGRLDAAERWDDGSTGPRSAMAKAAPGRCGGCGFLVPLAGALGTVFGACGNGRAPDDGRVVSLAYGCGAHSEVRVEQPESSYSGMAVEDEELEVVQLEPADAEAVATADVPEDASVPGVDEPLLDDVVTATEDATP